MEASTKIVKLTAQGFRSQGGVKYMEIMNINKIYSIFKNLLH